MKSTFYLELIVEGAKARFIYVCQRSIKLVTRRYLVFDLLLYDGEAKSGHS